MRICFVGDSLVAGTGDPEYLGWVGRVCAAARRDGWDITAYNLGVRRETSADIRARWEREVECRLPAEDAGLLVFSFGNNDAVVEAGRPRVALADAVVNLRQIVAAARARWPVLMVGPVAFPNEEDALRRKLNGAYAAACDEMGVPYLDVLEAVGSSDVWLAEARLGDGVHPGAGGYRLLAGLFSAWPAWHAQRQRAGRLST
ncbi:MAG: lipase [Chloroflexi bacterium]|nr:lipase [Chloroflexota bacterium]